MPSTVRDYENRVRAANPTASRSQIKRAAKRLAWWEANISGQDQTPEEALQEVMGFFPGLKIRGVTPDPTARKAILGRYE